MVKPAVSSLKRFNNPAPSLRTTAIVVKLCQSVAGGEISCWKLGFSNDEISPRITSTYNVKIDFTCSK
jgi:hypothetical protein